MHGSSHGGSLAITRSTPTHSRLSWVASRTRAGELVPTWYPRCSGRPHPQDGETPALAGASQARPRGFEPLTFGSVDRLRVGAVRCLDRLFPVNGRKTGISRHRLRRSEAYRPFPMMFPRPSQQRLGTLTLDVRTHRARPASRRREPRRTSCRARSPERDRYRVRRRRRGLPAGYWAGDVAGERGCHPRCL
jgi:hypothetical protein